MKVQKLKFADESLSVGNQFAIAYCQCNKVKFKPLVQGKGFIDELRGVPIIILRQLEGRLV